MPSEFDLIRRYFTRKARTAVLGVGDDAALVRPRAGAELAVSTDMLVAGTHFFDDADPRLLGWKSLAVNVSDMAAMGATPRWATLAISLPRVDERWLAAFARGVFACARRFGVELIGGDTTRGPLNICVTILGDVPAGRALRRDAARAGDDVWVSGTLGDAALALAHLRGRIRLPARDFAACAQRLHAPVARVALGRALAGVAHAAIDVSDGFAADLGHILERSRAGALVRLADLPRSAAMLRQAGSRIARACLLAGGDDYELCFTAPPAARRRIETIARRLRLRLTRVGAIESRRGLRIVGASGKPVSVKQGGYDHFG
ncbi:MAG TPA: thiamine-phosphate kinase [Burkholderiales bacterium]|nr:thiamine-phosphate kinase [Burkholderiales bacterium]